MGYYCVFIQIRERVLMDLEEDQIFEFVMRNGAPASRRTSLHVLEQYEHPSMAGELPPPISLEKMGLALHHLLTGEFRPVDSPFSRAILGGTRTKVEIGDDPARYLWADEVREISDALSTLAGEDLRRRFNPASLKAAWPTTPVSDKDDDEALFAELESYFRLLATYYRIAAARGNAMLIGVV